MTFLKNYDIIVAGLGTAGAQSLITAAKMGFKVLGIEKLSYIGGTNTAGGVSHYYYGAPGGAYEETDKKRSALRDKICKGCGAVRTDVGAYVLEREALNYGADLMLESVITEVYKEGDRVIGVSCFNGEAEQKIGTKIIIDATGDANICKLAGCMLQCGRKSDNKAQTFANLTLVRSEDNVYAINKDAGYVNQNSSIDLSKKIISSTAFSLKIVEGLRDKLPFVANTALLGCREGDRIVGEENVTFPEAAAGIETKKPVFYAFSNLDSHSKDTAFEDRSIKDWYIAAGLWGVAIRTAVPMGALIPKGIGGMLAAGRCMSLDHDIAACVRMMRDMKKSGEAAAVMACLAVKNSCDVKDVDYNELSAILKESGCLEKNTPHFAARTKEVNGSLEFEWLKSYDEIEKELASDSPGRAIWSAMILGDDIKNRLIECLESENVSLRKHSAFALALINEKSALKVLRETALEKDVFIPKSSVKFTYARGVTAAYLLGRLKDSESTELLLDIVRSHGAFDESLFVPDEMHTRADDMRFMFIQNAVGALIEIANAYPDKAEYIKNETEKVLHDDSFDIKIGLKGNTFIEFSMTDILMRQLENITIRRIN